jgi:hypothetical protein
MVLCAMAQQQANQPTNERRVQPSTEVPHNKSSLDSMGLPVPPPNCRNDPSRFRLFRFLTWRACVSSCTWRRNSNRGVCHHISSCVPYNDHNWHTRQYLCHFHRHCHLGHPCCPLFGWPGGGLVLLGENMGKRSVACKEEESGSFKMMNDDDDDDAL